MKFVNNQRTFISDFRVRDERGYVQVKDIKGKNYFFLPEHVLRQMQRKFSWDTYENDLNECLELRNKTYNALKKEYQRIEQDIHNVNHHQALNNLSLMLGKM